MRLITEPSRVGSPSFDEDNDCVLLCRHSCAINNPIVLAPHIDVACHADTRCKAWSFSSAACQPKTATALCSLKHAVPMQMLARNSAAVGASCEVRSGVPAAEVGLLPLEYTPLKLGSVKPTGWLKNQLVIMANGLSGHLDRFRLDVNESVWIGGKFDLSGAGHERGPYWLNGVVPLVAQLNASGDASGLNIDPVEQVGRFVINILYRRSSLSTAIETSFTCVKHLPTTN